MSENTDYETLKAERDAALNTCTLIADALGITGAVAGETIAKVQQLVAENVAVRSEVVCWAKECDRIVHRHTNKITDMHQAQAASELDEILKETTQALNEIKAQGVEMFSEFCKQKAEARAYTFFTDAGNTADEFAASLRGE
ncbi:hypothetical protein GBL98_20755 [Yersinia pseudotuberculosis]|uniref:hypothetical protein n=1 Tax=Yersinia pseudotuberculosis TaxID=633 RepID=UPI0005DF5112|nr:hypothetical protein [Yersinia pseudotuberculosis]AYX13988.1 hypothetical protein EGX44_01650 [Yersinia pseudotuberculosis]AYX15465.1 hypothetical protein EGX44_09820 [Yersinia pseudotuberculosis]MBO1609286.1 hypothetical protein [Yersinia pseudotuberculosis]MBO1613380.1 hypothetical protein [Yersinia pseudotuberculosis]MBO1623501.1 hypothetical protein [Yersinia pseudotuberculosis]